MPKIDILLSTQFSQIYDKERNASLYFKGYVFFNNKKYENKSLLYDKNIRRELLKFDYKFFRKLDGNFAVVIKKENKIALCVDRIRSIPLFYSYNKFQLYISDKAEIINKKIKGHLDPVSFEEYKFTGYVTNENTLIKDIKQAEAGDYIEFSVSKEHIINRKVLKYFAYRPHPQKNQTKRKLLKDLNQVFSTTFKKLLNFADGRKIVIPLSGGLDSRLIVYFLHKLNYKNVLCFSYGKPNNWEAIISKNVARRCNFQWKFVTYTRKMWRKLLRSNEGKNYFKFTSNLTSLAHNQDYMAIKSLKKQKIISSDSIIVPGHSLDFIVGSHQSNTYFSSELSEKEILQTILKKHYNLAFDKEKIFDSNYYNAIKDKIYCNLSNNYPNIDSMKSDYENWDYKERQAKYIVNSIRVYDYFSIKWALPFYYKELLEFWKSVSYKLKFKKKLFKIYIKNRFLYENIECSNERIPLSTVQSSIMKKAKIYYKDKKEHISTFFFEYFNHPLQWYGIFPSYFSYLKFSKPLFYKYVILEDRFLSYYLHMNLKNLHTQKNNY